MDNMLEKITLYDVLGCIFPGIYFISIVLFEFCKVIPKSIVIFAADHDAVIIVVLITLSHVVGAMLSAISESSLSKCLYPQQFAKTELRAKENDKLITDINDRIGENRILEALKRHNALFNDEKMINKKIIEYIYTIVQADPDYSRIHGYSSTEVMNRNTSCASLTGCILTLVLVILRMIGKFDNKHSVLFQLIIAVVLGIIYYFLRNRSENFAKRKIYYAVIWFVSKYGDCHAKTKEMA